ncbi:MAG: lamin tail domain-containing protein [Planctomycetota bacterium]|nr:lamin tail domain-containing protein [Planctomycetota bacterium]
MSSPSARNSRVSRSFGIAALACLLALLATSSSRGQERPALFINEIIADNGGVRPFDVSGGSPDMIEIYNASGDAIVLGVDDDAQSFFLSDTLEFCVGDACPEGVTAAWRFPEGLSTIPPRSSIVIFCDGDAIEGDCELHASFQIDERGTEPITLWGPVDPESGERPVVDRVWLPPLARDVSFGRLRDGAGPAPVPVGETFDHFVFHRLGTPEFPSDSEPSFGSCAPQGRSCFAGESRLCLGGPNETDGVNLIPRVTRIEHSTNSPAIGEAVTIVVRVRDDKEPTPEHIARVEIRYRVDSGEGFGTVQTVAMEYDAVSGVTPDLAGLEPCDPRDPNCDFPERPLDRRTRWTGTIPGQPTRSRVEFHFTIEDTEGLNSTSPRPLCEEVFPDGDVRGPCDRRFGGEFTGAKNCRRDLDDVTCHSGPGDPDRDPAIGERFIQCDAWLYYAVGYPRRPALEGLVINEVVPLQQTLLADPTHRSCEPADMCPDDLPDCCKRTEDFIELHNTSDREIPLAGLRLSDRFFRPRRGWEFPEGSKILKGQYLIVWIDNDGAQCPDEMRGDPPCFWECPDPTDAIQQVFHTSFNLNFEGDQIFLFDTAENDFGLIHGLDFSLDFSLSVEDVDKSLSLLPDGNRQGCFVLVDEPTPGEPNVGEPPPGECPGLEGARFIRGDPGGNCNVDLSDAVQILNWLFQGGPAPDCPDAADSDDNGQVNLTDAIRILNFLFLGGPPPPDPGPDDAGPDPTNDDLGPCVSPNCP